MTRKPFLLCSAGLVLAIAACDTSTGVLPSDITQADANELAAAMDDIATLGTNDFGLAALFSVSAGGSAASSSVPVAIDNQFTVTKPCPKGGQVAIAGRTTGEADRASHTLSLRTVATRTDTNCAFQTRRGVITINGDPNIVFDGHLKIEGGRLSGPQTQTQVGFFTWARNGGAPTRCEVNIRSSFDPATHTAIVSGTFCGRTVNVSRTRG